MKLIFEKIWHDNFTSGYWGVLLATWSVNLIAAAVDIFGTKSVVTDSDLASGGGNCPRSQESRGTKWGGRPKGAEDPVSAAPMLMMGRRQWISVKLRIRRYYRTFTYSKAKGCDKMNGAHFSRLID